MLSPALRSCTLLLGLSLASAPAYAAIQNVVCDGDTTDDATPSDSKKIADALDLLQASGDTFNTLNLSGTCSLIRPVEVRSFPNIVIQGPATLSAPALACGAAPAPGTYAGTMLSVIDTRSLNLREVSIVNGAGVLLQDSSATFLGVSVTGSRGEGVSVQGASSLGMQGGTLTGPAPGTFVPTPNSIGNNCNNGLNIGPGSTASMFMLGSISNNGGAGVVVNGGTFSASGCCTAENVGLVSIDNNRQGISIGLSGGAASVNGGSTCNGLNGAASVSQNKEFGVVLQGPSFFGVSGLAVIENNQTAPTSAFALAYRAGIFAGYGSRVFVSPGAQIRDTNGGPGIWGDMQSLVRLGSLPLTPVPGSLCTLPSFPNASITSNDAEGIRLTKMSAADGQSVVSITGNSPNDAVCDATSYLFGVNTGINKNKCTSK